MSSREWFGLVIRVFGLWHFSRGLESLTAFLDLRFVRASDFGQVGNPNSSLLYAVAYFVASFVLLRFTRGLMDWLDPIQPKRLDDLDDLGQAPAGSR